MTASPLAAALYGAAAGALTGWLSRLALKKVLNSADKIFYSVFAAGLFCRLALLLAAVCLLRHEKYIIITSFAGSFILLQTVFEAFPLSNKQNGIKRNS